MLNIDLFGWQEHLSNAPDIIKPWKPQPLSHGDWPPDYKGVYAWRMQTLQLLRANPHMLASAKAYYSLHRLEFILHWMDTYDPRKNGSKWVPFVFFAKQAEFIDFLEELRISQQSGLVEKARDMGATWLACGYSVASWLFINDDAIGWGSRKQELVDRLGDPDSIFEKMRLIINRLPDIWRPEGLEPKKHLTFMKCINPENGATISGESGDNIGRGGRKSMYFKDEAQPLTAGILTPNGWKTMSDMRVGSHVIGSDGKPTIVTHINDVGIAPVYRVSFSDGTATECSENHLWTVERKIGKSEILTLRTSELINKIRYVSPGGQIQYRYRIPTVAPIEFEVNKPLPLHPWIVGALIGDGKVHSGCPVFTTVDNESVFRFLQYSPEGTHLSYDGKCGWRFVDSGNRYNKSSRAKNAVKAAGIWNKRSYEKFIPDVYKFSSVSDRLHLLQGLMDTDGSASGGVASYHTCSERLANDVRFIVQSLGGTATMNVKSDHRGYRDMFVLHITIPNVKPFALTRKNEELRVRKHSNDKTIMAIEYVRDDIVRCITVSNSDGLYVTDNCILTHNSAHYERPEKIEAALGDNTNVQVDISSVNGLGNPFHRRREAGIIYEPGKVKDKPGFTQVFIIDWRDHPDKTQEWYDTKKAKYEREGMSHLFAQEVDRNYSAAISNTVIPYHYIQAAVDAHLIIPCLMRTPDKLPDMWWQGLDVADGGIDRNGLAKRQWVILRHVEEWGERDTGVTTRRAIAHARQHKNIRTMYDAIGLGAGVKSEYNRITIDEKIVIPTFTPWNAGGGVLNPYDNVIEGDDESLCNDDYYQNLKAQAWNALYMRFYKTWTCVEAIKNNQPVPAYDADELISIDGTIVLLQQLMKELAQAVRKPSSRMKMMIDKQPDGTKSPNLADAVVMAYFPIPDDYATVTVGSYG